MSRFKVPLRVWILIIALFLALLAINPSPSAKGIQIKSIDKGEWTDMGLNTGQIVSEVNGQPISTIPEFYSALLGLENTEQNITILTNESTEYTYAVKDDIGFTVGVNLTVIESTIAPLHRGEILVAINSNNLSNSTDFNRALDTIIPKKVVKITTNKGQFAFLSRTVPKISVGQASKTNIRKGLDLEGGTRVLLRPVSEKAVTDQDITELISVLSNRLNVYGLTDLKIRAASDWVGNKYILIEIAGVTKDEVKDLIGQQGKFEAKIGNETVFSGGKKDVPFVCRDDGSCSGIKNCFESGGQSMCRFEFAIHLSPEAAERHANITKELEVVASESGKEILSENLDLYLDGKLVDTLQIGSDLKGSETTSIAISGPGVGANRNAAVDAAVANMNKLQTILITGSLPFELEVDKLDSISPILGRSFVKNSILVGLVALIAVALVIFIRYRNLKIILPMMITSTSELVLILGFAALTHWNLDTASIAGIIAAIGTGVDHQIVIIDEVSKSGEKFMNWKQQIKRAFFIIFVAYVTTVAAMIPLWNAGAGLLRGFALTTIVGVSIGVFITRPAFAAIAEKLAKKY
ncbi:MAG: hypothetical protein ABIB71_08090 [Candidatus Woesearchaeota archaeon]